MPCQSYCIGVDASSDYLDLDGLPGQSRHRFANTPESHAALAAQLSALRAAGHDVLVVLEASGGCERGPHRALVAAGVPAAIVNPQQVGSSPARRVCGPRPTGSTPGRSGGSARSAGRARRRCRSRPGPS